MLAPDGVPVIADDAAVTMTAGHAARTILDIVDGHPPPADAAWLLLGCFAGLQDLQDFASVAFF